MDRARSRHRVRQMGHAGGGREDHVQSTRPGVFFGGDAACGPKNIIWAVEHGHEAAISIHDHCQGDPVTERPPDGMNLISQKMGISEWSYHNDYNPASRQKMKHVDLVAALRADEYRSRARLHRGTDRARSAALPELRRRRPCSPPAKCIECDACIDICPLQCLTITRDGDERRFAQAALGARAQSRPRPLRFGAPSANRPSDGEGRGSLRSLRPMRRTLPHRGVGHAEVRAR